MALKPTIYKAQVELADSDRNCFEPLALTIARHPSETLERMAARLLAYCLHCANGLSFTRGLSTAEEPDLWVHSESGELTSWIEVGQPDESRLRKACGKARQVHVYAFARNTPSWWKQHAGEISALPHIQVWQLDWSELLAFAGLLERTVKLNVSVVGGTVYIDSGSANACVEPVLLWRSDDSD